jgi:hypothetical protein
MQVTAKLLIPLLLLVGPCAVVALADGGTVRVIDQHGEHRIAVFTSPNPLRAGPVDVSVLVQDAETGQSIGNAHVALRLTAREFPSTSVYAVATSAEATNKLMQAALVELPMAGWWDVEIDWTTNDGTTHTRFAMEAQPPLPRWLTVWPWFTWPLAVVLLFVVHRGLVGRRPTVPSDKTPVSSPSLGQPWQATF